MLMERVQVRLALAVTSPRGMTYLFERNKAYGLRLRIRQTRQTAYADDALRTRPQAAQKRKSGCRVHHAVHNLMYNFCERITLHVVISQSAGRKWACQANYTMGIHICRAYFRAADPDPPDPEADIARYVLPIRPNRAARRKVVPQQAAYVSYRRD